MRNGVLEYDGCALPISVINLRLRHPQAFVVARSRADRCV
jgi:hypothetical protein